MPAYDPGVTAVIPNWNGGDRLKRLLRDLRAQTRPIARIVVVDNGSSDDSAEAARYLNADVVSLKKNFGFAAAVNVGINETRTELIAILNNDITLDPNWVELMSRAFRSASVMYATGKSVSADNPARIDGTFDAICRGGTSWRCGQGRKDEPMWNEPRIIELPPFTAIVLRRTLFDEVGTLDERFESYLEDVDFGLRCASRGYTGRYIPEAVCHHVGSATFGRWNPSTVRKIARNQVFLVAKHFPGVTLWRNGWAIAVAQLVWGGVALRHGSGLAYLRGKFEGVRRIREFRRAGNAAIPRLLRDSEAEILELQRKTGFDWYWRIYFALT